MNVSIEVTVRALTRKPAVKRFRLRKPWTYTYDQPPIITRTFCRPEQTTTVDLGPRRGIITDDGIFLGYTLAPNLAPTES